MQKSKILYDYAFSMVGKPYRWGGDDPMTGFDCSGLVIEIYKAVGLLPMNYDNTAQGLLREFLPKSIEPKTPCLGALCFFGKALKKITHVGLALNETLMLEAGGGNSLTRTEDIAVRQNAYVRVRPINSRKFFKKIILPIDLK